LSADQQAQLCDVVAAAYPIVLPGAAIWTEGDLAYAVPALTGLRSRIEELVASDLDLGRAEDDFAEASGFLEFLDDPRIDVRSVADWISALSRALGAIEEMGVVCAGYPDSARSPLPPPPPCEELLSSATAVSGSDLLRTAEEFAGDRVLIRGTVVEVSQEEYFYINREGGPTYADGYRVRVATSDGGDVLVYYSEGERLVDGDRVEVVGLATGVETYTAVLGSEVTLPKLTAIRIVRTS